MLAINSQSIYAFKKNLDDYILESKIWTIQEANSQGRRQEGQLEHFALGPTMLGAPKARQGHSMILLHIKKL